MTLNTTTCVSVLPTSTLMMGKPCGRFKHLSLLLLFMYLTASLGIENACKPLDKSVKMPILIRLVFAGTRPLFMRDASWSAEATRRFEQQLSSTVRYHAQPTIEQSLQLFTVAAKREDMSCSALEYEYTYQLRFAPKSTAEKLDAILSAQLHNSSSMFVHGTTVANKFHDLLVSENDFRESKSIFEYNVLIYDASSVAPQYGYVAEKGEDVETIGIATSHRFTFLDVGAKPFIFDDSHDSTPGEILLSLSSHPDTYAKQLHKIVSRLLTPPISPNMHRFPPENRLIFRLTNVDVSAVIGRISGTGGDSMGNAPIGTTFNKHQFVELLRDVFRNPVANEKQIALEEETVDMATNAKMAMAVARAFSMKGLEMVLESTPLLRDILVNETERAGYFVDSSYVAHIPLYLFSFADDTRTTHFESGRAIRAQVVDKQVVFLVENRLTKQFRDDISVTSAATKEVIELLCGLTRDALARMDLTEKGVPILLRDIARRNIVAQELDWSQHNVVGKAVDLLNFEGHDQRLIPHENGTVIAECLSSVRKTLDMLYASWDATKSSLMIDDVERVSLELLTASRTLADKLHEEICKQPLTEEILMEVELGDEAVKHSGSKYSLFRWVILPALIGIICSTLVHIRGRSRQKSRGATLGEIATASVGQSGDVQAKGRWFSTLSASDKPKLN